MVAVCFCFKQIEEIAIHAKMFLNESSIVIFASAVAIVVVERQKNTTERKIISEIFAR